MYPVSDEFLETIQTSHRVYTRAVVYDRSGVEHELNVVDGAVTLDIRSATRGSLDLTLAPEEEFIPLAPDSLLAPYGNEVHVWRGVYLPDGSFEAVPLGIYRIDSTQVSDTGSDLGLSVSGLDRSAKLIEAVMENGGQIASGTNCKDAIESLIFDVDPAIPTAFTDTGVTLPLLNYEAGDDRWDLCQGIAEAAGCDLYFDNEGVLVLRAIAIRTEVDFPIAEGDGGSLIQVSKDFSRENAVNRVTVSGETSTGDPVFAASYDDVPGSPTEYGGPFGRVTYAYSSSYVTSEEQAARVAGRILQMKLGIGQQIGFEALVNPALGPLDVISIARQRMGVTDIHLIDSITIPLAPEGTMSGLTRLARVVAS